MKTAFLAITAALIGITLTFAFPRGNCTVAEHLAGSIKCELRGSIYE